MLYKDSEFYNSFILDGVTYSSVIKDGITYGDWMEIPMESETKVILDFAQSKGYSIPTNLEKINNLIKEMKLGGVWELFDFFYFFDNDGDNNFRSINWIKPSGIIGTVKGGLIRENKGFKGNGTNGYFETNFNPTIGNNKYKLDDAHRGVLQYSQPDNLEVIPNIIDGIGSLPTHNTLFNLNIAAQKINQGTVDLRTSVNMRGNFLKVINRTSSSDVDLINNGSQVKLKSNSIALEGHSQTIFSRGNGYSQLGISAHFMGKSMSLEKYNNLKIALGNYVSS